MKQLLHVLLTFLLSVNCLFAQVYTEKQTRHRFAQLNLGVGYQTSLGGNVHFLDENGGIQAQSLGLFHGPRVLIGGTHFWGHADFYLSIPLFITGFSQNNQKVSASNGVESVFKFYPWRIQHNKIRPFIGASLAPFYFEQRNENLAFGNGPELDHIGVPLHGGFTFNRNNHLVELGLMWNYNHEQAYYISRMERANVETPPFYVNLSYRLMIETTLSAEESWESGRTAYVTEKLEEQKRLNSFHLGVGLSSAWWLERSSYNEVNRPYVEIPEVSIMPDVTIGYYLHKPDFQFAAAFRRYSSSTDSYGTVQELRRTSLVLEGTKFLFDYHGFVPFIGPAISREWLEFTESFEGLPTQDKMVSKIHYGLTFGWDIRPNRLQSWILRTNLRWFPNLDLEVADGQVISFDNIEFNFIQLIVYLDRMIKINGGKK